MFLMNQQIISHNESLVTYFSKTRFRMSKYSTGAPVYCFPYKIRTGAYTVLHTYTYENIHPHIFTTQTELTTCVCVCVCVCGCVCMCVFVCVCVCCALQGIDYHDHKAWWCWSCAMMWCTKSAWLHANLLSYICTYQLCAFKVVQRRRFVVSQIWTDLINTCVCMFCVYNDQW